MAARSPAQQAADANNALNQQNINARMSATDWVVQAQQDGTRASYARAFLQQLGAPLSNNNIALLLAVMQNEGTSARYNPMASTWTAPGATDFNSVHVRNYADVASAIAAQVTQWRKVFPTITAALMSDNAASALGSSEWNSYSGNSTGSYQQRLAGNYRRFSGDPSAGQGLVGTQGGGPGGGATGANPATYSQYAFLANDPDIGPALRDLASGAINDGEFQNRVQNSRWWKTHSGSARAWQQLQASDPASYNQRLHDYTRQIVETASQLGVGLDIPTILKLANQFGAENWTPQDLTNSILGYSNPARAQGGLAAGMEQVRKAANDYGINLTDRQAFDYERQIAMNQATAEGISADFAEQAKARMPHLADILDKGFTLAQIAQPYINAAAQTLEVDPTSVDLSDPKWSRMLAFHDGNRVRQMTQYEWQQTMMSDPVYGWNRTQNAQGARTSIEKTLDGVFGVGAS